MNFSFNNERPIYIQLLEQLEIFIISGNLEINSKLPSVRDLALITKVNPNTVQRALQELESLGLIYTLRTNGKYVTSDKKLIDKYKAMFASLNINNYLNSMSKLGLDKKQAIDYLKKGGYDL